MPHTINQKIWNNQGHLESLGFTVEELLHISNALEFVRQQSEEANKEENK